MSALNGTVGNPVSAARATEKIRAYVEETYQDVYLEVPAADYSFKDGSYGSLGRSSVSLDTVSYTHLYVRDRLKILSGLYGLLRPFDGIVPYRLEMQAPLSVGGKKDLYGYWGDAISRALMEEAEDGIILNLASREYAKTVEPYLSPSFRLIHCVFGERGKDGKIRVKGTQAKMAQGEMVRWLAERGTDLSLIHISCAA